MTGPDRLALARKAREMYREENAKNVQPFEELPRYAQEMYLNAARRELERAELEQSQGKTTTQE